MIRNLLKRTQIRIDTALRRMEEMLMQLDWDGISEIAASVSG